MDKGTMEWMSRRLDQPLELYVLLGEQPTDAMARWIDKTQMNVLARERLPLDEPLRAYLDVRAFSRQVEVELICRECARPPDGSSRSWIHLADWRTVDPGDDEWLQERLYALNPALGIEQLPSASTSRSRRRGSRSSTTGSGSSWSAPPHPQHQALFNAAGADVAASLLVRLRDQRELVWSVRLDVDALDVRLRMAAPPPEGVDLLLLIEFPDGAYVQAAARVLRERKGRVLLRVPKLSAADLAVLHRALK